MTSTYRLDGEPVLDGGLGLQQAAAGRLGQARSRLGKRGKYRVGDLHYSLEYEKLISTLDSPTSLIVFAPWAILSLYFLITWN